MTVPRKDGLSTPRGIPFHHLTRYWAMTSGEGTVAYDHGDAGDDAALTDPTWTTGRFKTALEFNGSSTYGAIDGPPSMHNEFTVCWWATHDAPSDGDNDTVWFFRENNDMYAEDAGNGNFRFFIRDTDIGDFVRLDATVEANVPHFWAVRYDGSTCELLKNRVVQDSSAVGSPRSGFSGASIGRRADTTDRYFSGTQQGLMAFDTYLDDAMLWRIQQWRSRWVTGPYLSREGGTMHGPLDFNGIPADGVDTGGATPSDTSTPVAWEEVTGEDGSTYYRPLYQ
jgi:hypothetical protein